MDGIIRKPQLAKPNALENFKPKLHELVPELKNLTGEELEKLLEEEDDDNQMSLREEIKDIFIYEFDQYGVDIGENADKYVVQVMKVFEKRIDEIRKEEEFNSYDMGWNMSLEKFKEMLK